MSDQRPGTGWGDHCEGLYLKRRQEEGRPGWTTADQLRTDIDHVDAYLQETGLPLTGRGLELGAGAGNIALHLAALGLNMSGVELSEQAVDWARDNARKAGIDVTFYRGDVCDPAAAQSAAWGGAYDLILDGHCLHWLVDDDRRRYLSVARALLARTGHFWVRSMCGDPPAAWMAKGGQARRDGLTLRWDPNRRLVMAGDAAVSCLLPAERLLAELAAAGFDVVHRRIWPPADAEDAAELFCLARPVQGPSA